ncbi:DUF4976 domain-containing protein [bacterium]|nr:MAG: DUF4976 domain-containing protein [bacterium]
MERREFLAKTAKGLGAATILPLVSGLNRCASKLFKRPNVLLFIVEDLNMQLRCYGKSYMHTPNIDRLASEGLKFDQAYVQQAVCAASRASLFTGLFPQSTGVDYPYSYYFVEEILPKYGTLTERFQKNGYYTRDFGKIQHGVDNHLSTIPFKPDNGPYMMPENIALKKEKGGAAVPPYEMGELLEDTYPDAQTAKAVIKELQSRKQSDQPFFLSVGFLKPHLPLAAPKKYWDLYKRDEIPLAENKYRPKNCPPIAIDRYNLKQYQWEHSDPDRLFSDDYARLIRHAYFACVSFMDAQVGQVLNELDKLNLRDDTIVFFLSDHGFHLGEQNHWGKTTLFESSLHVPLILSVPGMQHCGQSSTAFVEYVDIFPTLLELVDIKVPDYLEGVSFEPLLKNPERNWKKATFSVQSRSMITEEYGYSMRTTRYRYTEWRNDADETMIARELYDLKNDPGETVIIAEKVGQSLLNKLSKQLRDGWENALPEGVKNRSHNPVAPPSYAWGPEGDSRRAAWHEKFGGKEGDDWWLLTKQRLQKSQNKMEY